MSIVKLKYTGGRSQVKASWVRREYIFNKANDYTADVPSELAKELLIAGGYRVVPTISDEVATEVASAAKVVEEKPKIVKIKKKKGAK